jgi:hypothetical protein
MRVVDLFSGTRGWTQAMREEGHEVFSIDNDPRFTADAYLDLRSASAALEAIPWRPDLIVASPMCASFSTMSMGKMWDYGHQAKPKHSTAQDGMSMVLAILRIIAVMAPEYWIIENPRGRLRSLELLEGVPRYTVWYCRLGMERAKPTDLFGVVPRSLNDRLMSGDYTCHNGNPDHIAAPRGSRSGTQGGVSTAEAGAIPYVLSKMVYTHIEAALRFGDQTIRDTPAGLWGQT